LSGVKQTTKCGGLNGDDRHDIFISCLGALAAGTTGTAAAGDIGLCDPVAAGDIGL
jgi:hypothetical protein